MYQPTNLTPAVARRVKMEQRLVKKTVAVLLADGFELNVDNGGDEPELPDYTRNRAAVLAALMETDEDFLLVRKVGTAGPDSGERGWVRFVYGNDGWDVVSDYTMNLEKVLAPVNQLADSLEN